MKRLPLCGPKPLRHHGRSVVMSVAFAWLVTLSLLVGPLTPSVRADVKSNPGEKTKKDKDKKDKKGVPSFLPEAIDGSAKFVAGKSVDIELEASVPTVKPVEFLIRQQPVYGTLSAVRPHPRENNKAIVTYTHNSVDAGLSDRFTFACRVGDGDISAQAVITLTGQKYEPILAVQNVTMMRKVFLGGESSLRFTVKNTGPAAYTGDISWESPWKGPPHLDLQPNETAELTVAFQPTAAGVFRLDRILQQGHNESRLMLYGECVRPLTVSPGRLALVLDPKTGERQGTVTLANGLTGPQKAKIKLPPRLVSDTEVEIPGAGQSKVTFSIPAKDFEGFKDKVIVSTQDALEVIIVEAEPKPADLHVIKPAGGVLDMGKVPQGEESQGQIVLKNTGGQPAVVQGIENGIVHISPSGKAIQIAPGAEGIFTVTVRGDQIGFLQTEAHIQGAGQTLRVPLKGEVTAPVRTATASPLANGAGADPTSPSVVEGSSPVLESPQGNPVIPRSLKPLMFYLQAKGVPVPKDRINPYLERVAMVQVLERGAHALTLAWRKPSMMPAGWSIEVAALTPVPTGGLAKDWLLVKDWEPVKVDDDHVGARIKGLRASTQVEFRLSGVDRDGKVSEPATFIVETKEAWKISPWVWRGALSIALLAVLFSLYQIREGYWDPTWPPLRRVLGL